MKPRKTKANEPPGGPGARQGAMAGKGSEHSLAVAVEATQLVTFLLKNEEFGFDIMAVQEIIRLPRMSKLPRTPEYLEGVSTLRGAVLPVVDIRARFGMEREQYTDRSRVLVVDIDGQRTGLLVDGVRQVTRVAAHEFEPPPAAIRGAATDYLKGVVKLEEGRRIIFALDARRVCAFAETFEASDAPGTKAADSAGGQKRAKAFVERRKGSPMQQLVSFQVGREEFAFPMKVVREILRVETPKEVPGAPEHLLGVLTVRGQILPIVDLRRLMRQKSLAHDQAAVCRQVRSEFELWLTQNEADGSSADSRVAAQTLAAATEHLRQWLTAFSSSSQTLMETIAQARGLNEQAIKQTRATLEREPAAAAWQAAHGELAVTAKAIVAALRSFEALVETHLREDQRIIVVDCSGFQLGLVVDHVNEVLGVQEDAIEATPEIARHEGFAIAGIAKLDDGARLILLLSTANLLENKVLAEIAGEGEGPAAEELRHGEHKEAGEGSRGEELQFVTFLLGEEEYGIPISSIQEIDRLSRITQTPKAPKFVEGVTNLRGEVIPVLSTRMLFSLDKRAADDRTRVIIVDMGGSKTGLVVDSVKEVLSISTGNIAQPPASIAGGADAQFISGIGKVEQGKRMIVLLDLERVLTRESHESRSDQADLAVSRRAA